MRARYSVLVVVVGIAVLMLTFGLPTSSARGTSDLSTANAWGHTIVVKPNGSDDTADLQAAFNACVSYGPGCTVQLVKGTYYTAQITVYGFEGTFVGAGQGRTIVQALPNLPQPAAAYNTPTSPFWAGLPGPANPWPDLFTFVNGVFGISGMTITEPYANPIVAPGWQYPAEYGDTTYTALWAVILVTGEQANAAISQVTVNGAGGDIAIPVGTPSTFNLDSSIMYYGMLLPSGWTDPLADQIPLSGSFSLTDSVIYWGESAFWFENLLSASVMVCYNSINSSPSPGVVDVSNSQLTFCGNSITNVAAAAGVSGAQSLYKSNLLPSTVYVTDNYFTANWGGSGPVFFDFGPLFWGIPSTLSAVVTGNTVVTDTSCGCYLDDYPAIGFGELASFVASGNLILGGGVGVGGSGGPASISGNTILGAIEGVGLGCPGGVGCILYPEVAATDEHVSGNVIVNSGQYGIAVQDGSSDNVVAHNFVTGSGVDDLYWDGTGTGNVWFGNVCKTSSPPGLC